MSEKFPAKAIRQMGSGKILVKSMVAKIEIVFKKKRYNLQILSVRYTG
jgi:hypothetical protein